MALLAKEGVHARLVTPPFDSSLHAKFAICDLAEVIVGSHNWSHNAFAVSREDSIAVRSLDLAAILAAHFDQLWMAGETP